MSLSLPHRLALAGAVGTSAIALGDALTHGLTGDYSIAADDSGVLWAYLVSAVVHGLTYAAFLLLLVHQRGSIDARGRAARLLRRVLVGAFGILAVVFLLLSPVRDGVAALGLLPVVEGVAGVAFLAMFVAGVGLGFALWRSPEHRAASRLLVGLLPVLAVTLVLGWLAPDFAHPAYLETMLHFGIALLGLGTVRRRASVRATTTEAAAR